MTLAPPAPAATRMRREVPAASSTEPNFIKQHPVLAFYALTFAISWAGVLLVIGGPGAIPGTPAQVESRMLYAVLALFAGPSVASLVLTGVVHGKKGYRELLSRLLKWRVGVRWYAAAILTAPLVFISLGLGLSLISPTYLPGLVITSDKAMLLLVGVIAAFLSLLEEIGWTGFATPALRRRHGVLTTGLIVGVLWGTWHSLLNSWSNGGSSGTLPLIAFLPLYVLVIGIPHLTAYRMLMVWVYDRTGSLLVAWLMHASFAASTFVLGPAPLTGVAFLTWFLIVTAAFWGLVAAVAVATRKDSRGVKALDAGKAIA